MKNLIRFFVLVFLIPIISTGCFFIDEKVEEDLRAEIRAEIEAEIRAEIEVELSENEITEAANQEELEGALNKGNGYMILTIDDGYFSDYHTVFPLLEERGIKAVIYINPDYIDRDLEEYMTWEEVRDLRDAGWDIQDHTYSHPKLTIISNIEIEREMNNVNNAFIAQGLKVPDHHAYPFGHWNDRVRKVVSKYRKTMRTTAEGLNSRPFNFKELKSNTMIYSMDVLKGFIDEAVKKDELVTFYAHDVQKEHGYWGNTQEEFIELIDYAIESGIEIVTLSELYEKYKETDI